MAWRERPRGRHGTSCRFLTYEQSPPVGDRWASAPTVLPGWFEHQLDDTHLSKGLHCVKRVSLGTVRVSPKVKEPPGLFPRSVFISILITQGAQDAGRDPAMSITDATLTAVLNLHGVPKEFHSDPELLAITYVLAALEEPTSEVEQRFYDSATTFNPEGPSGEMPRTVTNRDLLEEIHKTRLSYRLHQLRGEDHHAEAG